MTTRECVDFPSKKTKKQKKKQFYSTFFFSTFLYLHTLFIYITHVISARSVFSPFVNIKRDVYDNYASHDEEKRTDDEYREELLFVFCFCGRESFSFVVYIIVSNCISDDGVN